MAAESEVRAIERAARERKTLFELEVLRDLMEVWAASVQAGGMAPNFLGAVRARLAMLETRPPAWQKLLELHERKGIIYEVLPTSGRPKCNAASYGVASTSSC